jgi:acetate kinase
MKILAINAGSSSLKFTLFEMPGHRPLATGQVERIGDKKAALSYEAGAAKTQEACAANDHRSALQALMGCLVGRSTGVLSSLDEVSAVGHRVVHGGRLSHSVLVDEKIESLIRENSTLAPLHNPYNLAGIEAARQMLPGKPQAAVFDTAFHASMPPHAFLYAVPYSLYTERQVRVYGFHGTSHRYVTHRAAGMLGVPISEVNLITLHLGNGCSAAAVRNGHSVDTSMGMTPLQGLVMGTRCGDVDPGLFYFLTEWLRASPAEVYDMLNRRSGLAGLSGVSNDVRELLKAAAAGDKRADLALDVFAYRVRKYIGSYLAVLGKVHGIVFTAGIGENSPEVRRRSCAGLEPLGIVLDASRNEAAVAKEAVISADGSPCAILVVPTDEALQIAIETYDIMREGKHS